MHEPEQDMVNKHQQFEALVNALSTPLFRYAYWLCKNRSTAEDLVQETFARAWRSLDSLKDENAAKSWMFTIIRREHARLYERKRPEPMDLDFDNIAGLDFEYDTSTEAFVLRRALNELAPEYREPLVLQVIMGLSCDEIAEQLDLTTGAVMTRLFRARKQMRELVTGDSENVVKSSHQ